MKNNLSIKIIVLIIAIVLWVQQIMLKTHKQEIVVPLKLINVPEELITTFDELPNAGIKITASGLDILKLHFSDHFFEIDATDLKYGDNSFTLNLRNFRYPQNIDLDIDMLTSVADLNIILDKIIEEHKQVEIRYESAKDEEFFIKNRIINLSQKVKIRGPLRITKEIKTITTKKISAKMIEDDNIEIELVSPDSQIELFKDKIILKISSSKQINKLLSLIPIRFPEDQQISIIPQKVSVMVKGPQAIIENLNSRSITANLNIKKIKKGFTTVIFEIPSGIEIIEYTPQRIQVIQNQ